MATVRQQDQSGSSDIGTKKAPADGATRSTRGALAALSLSILLSSLGTSIANVGLPALAEAFGASFQEVQWIVLAYLLAITTLIVSMGRLGDMFGRRRLLLAGLWLFTAASVISGFAPTLMMLVVARGVQGLGAAIMMALAMALIGETVPRDRTGGAMGLLGTMSAVGTALGPSLGGLLISGFGWRAIFLVNVPLGLLALLFVRRHLPADDTAQDRKNAGFDLIGTLLLASTLAAYALAMTLGRGGFGPLNMVLLGLAGLGATVFTVAEARIASPLIRLSTIRQPFLGGSLAMGLLVSTVMMATLVVGPFYLSRALGLNAAMAGLLLSVGPVISMLSGIPAGRIIDRLGAPSMVAAGLLAMTTGCVALSFLPAVLGIGGYVAAIAILTPGYQLFQAANNTAVMLDVSPEQRGAVSGMINLSRNLGLVTGASVMGAVFASATGTTDMLAASAQAVGAGMRTTFLVAAGLTGLALVIALASRRAADRS
ncbi:MFS transporter [Rhizobium terrae]|uniref:MFS transporter n=1 Tax=Rhizobium terrae TaxID=2171756 RepID=UPI000E3DF509|nr:MFS transporter [Rhizobium terrae]